MDANQTIEEYEYLVSNTLLKMYGNPHKFAASKQMEYDDLYQFGLMGLWEATKTYEVKKIGTFKNYAIRNIRWKVKKSVALDEIKRCYYKTYSTKYKDINFKPKVESMSKKFDEESEVDYYDRISCDNITSFKEDNLVETKIFSKMEYNKILNMLNENEKELVSLKLNGYSYQQIGDKYGVSRQGIWNKFKRIQDKISRYRMVTA